MIPDGVVGSLYVVQGRVGLASTGHYVLHQVHSGHSCGGEGRGTKSTWKECTFHSATSILIVFLLILNLDHKERIYLLSGVFTPRKVGSLNIFLQPPFSNDGSCNMKVVLRVFLGSLS